MPTEYIHPILTEKICRRPLFRTAEERVPAEERALLRPESEAREAAAEAAEAEPPVITAGVIITVGLSIAFREAAEAVPEVKPAGQDFLR